MSIASNQRGSRNEWDFYPTPPHHTRAVMDYLPKGATVWECAAGDGSMADVLRARFEVGLQSDVYPRRDDIVQEDFLRAQQLPPTVRTVVTNPPFKLATQFVLHAIGLGATTVAMLMPVHYLGGQARRRELFRPFPFDQIVVVSKRMPQSQFNHAWYIWRLGSQRRQVEFY